MSKKCKVLMTLQMKGQNKGQTHARGDSVTLSDKEAERLASMTPPRVEVMDDTEDEAADDADRAAEEAKQAEAQAEAEDKEAAEIEAAAKAAEDRAAAVAAAHDPDADLNFDEDSTE